MLYGNILEVSETEDQEAIAYLAKEYENESLNYPFTAPRFDTQAALWAAKTVYVATQLMLYRENKESDLESLLPAYAPEMTPSAIVSADLLLRFLPDIIGHLKAIDPEDKLIEVLEKRLAAWHFSGVKYALPVNDLHFDVILSNPCLYQLYMDRVIENKSLPLARHPSLKEGVKASLGMYAGVYWNEFQQSITVENASNR
jgi:hypothetical protein